MASPFRIFRKHQKTLLVVAGVVLMFVFVLGDSLKSWLGKSPGGGTERRHPNAVAVSWNGGQLTNDELDMLVRKRQMVNLFLHSIEAYGRQRVAESGAELRPLRVVMVGGPDRPNDGVERDVVQTAVFAVAARKIGMQIDEPQILQYLEEIGRGRVDSNDMRMILSRLQVRGRAATDAFMMDALREELLARNFLLSYQYAWRTVLPEQRWQDWLRVNERVVVEAAAIPVSSFLVDVPEPTEAELKAFFVTPVDEDTTYQSREPLPDYVDNTELPSPTPGFAIPRKVDVSFLLGEFDKFLGKLEDEVTDEEIEKFYEANKDPYFIRADAGMTTVVPEEDTSEGKQDTEGGAPTDATEPPAASDSAAPSSDAAPVNDAATPSAEPAPATDDSSSNNQAPRDSKFRLAAFQQDDEADKTTAEGAAGADDTASDAAATADKPAEEPASPPSAEAKKPVEYQPLEEVRDQIRRQLAEQKVNDRLRELMGKLETDLHGLYINYLGEVFDAEATDKAAPAPPAKLADVAALAEENGLQSGKTGPVSFIELRDLPIGKSVTADENNYRYVQLAFSQEIELYQPVATFDLDNNRYLALKTSDTPGKVPTLDEVRDEVVQAWKMQQAADLALKHAEEAATKAQASGSWLADYFAGNKNVQVVRTDPFSWLTIGSVSPRSGMVDSFRLSQPEGIVAAGPAFMEKVFELQGNDVGAMLNHDHTIAYVLRVVEHQDTEEQLRQSFLSEANQWYGLPVMSQLHMQRAARDVVNDFLNQVYQVHWSARRMKSSERNEERDVRIE